MNWVEVGVLLVGAATAVFTGIQAMTTILNSIAVDFDFALIDQTQGKLYDPEPVPSAPQMIRVAARVHNRSNRTIVIKSLDVTDIPLVLPSHELANKHVKIHGGISRKVEVRVPVGSSETVETAVLIDWPKLAADHSSGTRGASLRSRIIIDRKSFVMPLISREDINPIQADIIAQNAEKTMITSVNQ